ncbi:FecR family protein [Flavobacteriaceae bacterium F08102]|nr:FecR family protein [Flavobacteriaceae bacterium F08102]
MISREIIDRFLKGEYSQEELEFLKNYFEKDEVEELYEMLRNDWTQAEAKPVPNEVIHQHWRKLKAEITPINQNKSKSGLSQKVITYGALIAASLLFGFFLFKPETVDSKKVIFKTSLNTSNSINIKLADGKIKYILPSGTRTIVASNGLAVAQQKENKLVYSFNRSDLTELRYNTLTVPLGKTFKVVLSDQSEIILNAGSSLRYPVQFLPNKSREVYLTGEGYFSIQKAKTSFVVHTTDISTTVFGTKFNISSYPSESTTKVVLEEGSISVNRLNTKKLIRKLVPNEMATYNKASKEIHISNVDISSYISWIDGVLLFKNENFSEIIKKLERHFDREIILTKSSANQAKFTGRFEVENLEEILKTIQKIVKFNFEEIDNKIYITP